MVPFTGTLLVQKTQSPLNKQCKLCGRVETKPKNFKAFIEHLLKNMMVSSRSWDTGSAALCNHLFPWLPPHTSSPRVCCFVHCCSPVLTDGQSRDSDCTLGGQCPAIYIQAICRQVCSALRVPVWTADNRKPNNSYLFSFSPPSLFSLDLSPSPSHWHEFPRTPVLWRFITPCLFTKPFQILKQRINTTHHAEQVIFC